MEALFLVCGAGGPQLKRKPLGSSSHIMTPVERILCVTCCTTTPHVRVWGPIGVDDQDPRHPGTLEETLPSSGTTYDLLQCTVCKEPTLRAIPYALGEGEAQLFPLRDQFVRWKPFNQLPTDVHLLYNELISSFLVGSYTLCEAGIRILFEKICDDKGIRAFEEQSSGPPLEKKGLAPRIRILVENLHPTKRDAVLRLKFLGDQAVHQASPPDISELRFGIEVLELLFTDAYGLDDLKRPL